jgi:hypothetical protein
MAKKNLALNLKKRKLACWCSQIQNGGKIQGGRKTLKCSRFVKK